MNRHAIPYAAASASCCCPVQACGGLIPDPDCPDHGGRREPAMEWHAAGSPLCLAAQAPASRDALRDRIADVLADADGWKWAEGYDKTRSPAYQGYQRRADAVLAVLSAA